MKNKTYWQKFQELHAFLLAAGAVVEAIHLKPSSFNKLKKEMLPIGKYARCAVGSKLLAAVTHSGQIRIVRDKSGVSL